ARSAKTTRGRTVHLGKRIKQVWQLVGVNADAGVRDTDANTCARGTARCHDSRNAYRTLFGKLDRIAKQVGKDLPDARRVGTDLEICQRIHAFELQRQSFLLGYITEIGDAVSQRFIE